MLLLNFSKENSLTFFRPSDSLGNQREIIVGIDPFLPPKWKVNNSKCSRKNSHVYTFRVGIPVLT